MFLCPVIGGLDNVITFLQLSECLCLEKARVTREADRARLGRLDICTQHRVFICMS